MVRAGLSICSLLLLAGNLLYPHFLPERAEKNVYMWVLYVEIGWRWDGDRMEVIWRWDGGGMEVGWQ